MKIFTATPMPFFKSGEPEDRFFSRDTGLLCRQFKKEGHESQVVLLDGPEMQTHADIIRCSLADMESPGWWQQHHPDAVVLYAWMLPRYLGIAQAVRQSGIKLISRCDSTGLYDPRIDLFEYIRQEFYGYGSSVLTKNNLQRSLRAVVKPAYRLMNQSYQKGVIAFADCCDELLIESTLAKERMQRFFRIYNRPDLAEKVRYVPHPIDVPAGTGGCEKEKLIAAVGRWDDYIKNGPLLIRVLIRVLKQHPDYRAVVIGDGSGPLRRKAEQSGLSDRIYFAGRIPHEEVQGWMHKAQVLLVTSRYESFNMAAAEALCCGESIVGSGHLPSMRDFTRRESGTLATSYTAASFLTATDHELNQWEAGCRTAQKIAETGQKQYSAGPIAQEAGRNCGKRSLKQIV